MRRVILESPFHGKTNDEAALYRYYLNEAIKDCIARGESPYASHCMLTEALDDETPAQRELGIEAGYAWWKAADAIVFYTDYGISPGMQTAMTRAEDLGQEIEIRRLGP